jgi:hypothetical protein
LACGLVHGGSRDLEELGKEYYHELILRNLKESPVQYVDQRACNMHDVVRLFAQYVARDEALAAHNKNMDIIGNVNSHMFIRLSLDVSNNTAITKNTNFSEAYKDQAW